MSESQKHVAEERAVQRFEIILHLESEEDLKRVLHHFNNLKMQMVREITRQPVQIIVSIECADYGIDGSVKKIGLSEGVISADRIR